MKSKSLLVLSFLLAAALFSGTAKAQVVNTGDSLALVDLYNSTTGTSWFNHTNWLTKKTVSKWYGVTVTGSRVTGLDLLGNNLQGTLPNSIGNLSFLARLNLGSNNISSLLPSSVGNLTMLTTLLIFNNKLSGSIPSAIGNLLQLDSLSLSSNRFSGTLTDSITRLTRLEYFTIENNQLSGALPAAIGNLTSLTFLALNNNKFSGVLPPSFTNLKKVTYLNASFNKLSGSLPADIDKLSSLQILYMDVNQFTGSIPASLGNISSLLELTLTSNQFTGSVPGSLSQLNNLIQLQLENNQLTGSIPSSFGSAASLQLLDLENNKLTGTIPSALGSSKSLQSLNVATNQLTGSVPPVVLKIPTLGSLYIYENQLTDQGNLSNVQYNFPNLSLYMRDNRYTFNTLQYVAANIPRSYYSPQAPLSVHQRGGKLAVSAGGTLSKNTYTWYQVGQPAGTTFTGDSTYKPTASGSYYATIINSIATAVTLTTDTVVYTVSPLAGTACPMKLSVYPNPARNSIRISGIIGYAQSQITITDVSGTVWLRSVAAPDASVQADISRLKPGNYTLHVTNGSNAGSVGFIKE